MKNGRELGKTIVLLVVISLIASSATILVYNVYEGSNIYHVEEIDTTFKIGEKLGFAIDSDDLNFGMAPYTGISEKEILLSHNFTEPVLVTITYTGDIAHVLLYRPPFILEPNEEKKVVLIAYANTPEEKTFTGKVIITYSKL